jgi:tetratricopeptide (TPR) repeat protein
MKLIVAVVASLLLGVVATAARADEERELKARQLYEVGKAAYTQGDYQSAYDNFRESFQLSHQPALLYNVASALQGLHRPHDAAEALRSFLRLRPDDPDKAQIEERIRTLEEEQRLLDLDRQAKEPPPVVTPQPPPPTVTPVQTTIVVQAPPPPERSHKRTWIIVGVAAGVVVAAGVTLGLVFGLQPKEQALTPSPIGPIAGTR